MKQSYKDTLHALESKHGELTPNIVVAEAKKKTSPLHDFFEWNDSKAASAYRIQQARDLIRSVRVIVETEERMLDVPEYVRDPSKEADEQGYRNIAKLRTEEDARRDVIVSEFARAGAALRRARDLAAFFGIEEDVDDTIRAVERLEATHLDA